MNISPLDFFLGKMSSQYVEELMSMYNAAKNNRSGWESKWSEINRLLFPAPGDFSTHSGGSVGATPPSTEITSHASIVVAKVNKIIAMLSALVADPASDWFGLKFVDFEMGEGKLLSDSTAANKWLKAINRTQLNLLGDPKSNFYPSLFTLIAQWYTFGTGYQEVILRQDGGICFDCPRIQDCAIAVNGYNEVAEVYRTLRLTARQAIDLYGDRVSEHILMEAKNSIVSSARHEFFEANIANPLQAQLLQAGLPAMPYVSIVVETHARKIVDIRQYPKLPYIVGRFDLAPAELYGRSYVWDCMPDIKIINKLSRLAVLSTAFSVEPAMLTKPSVSKLVSRIVPRAVLPWLDSTGTPVAAPLAYGTNPQILLEFYQFKLNELDETLAARDLFSQDVPSKTAFEVNERKIQLHNRLRSMIVRLETECLSPIIELVTLLLAERNALPPFPYEEVAEEFQIDPIILQMQLPAPILQLKTFFCGQLARMRSLEEANNAERVLQFAAQVSQINPAALDRINLSEIMKDAVMNYLQNEKAINSDKTVKEIGDARNNQVDLQESKMEADIAKEKAETEKLEVETRKLMQEAA
jgi:hypothetical protein